ncbi:MAG: hypothetical protein ACO3ZY_13760, partial [Phycisphaerales bacterium]
MVGERVVAAELARPQPARRRDCRDREGRERWRERQISPLESRHAERDASKRRQEHRGAEGAERPGDAAASEGEQAAASEHGLVPHG